VSHSISLGLWSICGFKAWLGTQKFEWNQSIIVEGKPLIYTSWEMYERHDTRSSSFCRTCVFRHSVAIWNFCTSCRVCCGFSNFLVSPIQWTYVCLQYCRSSLAVVLSHLCRTVAGTELLSLPLDWYQYPCLFFMELPAKHSWYYYEWCLSWMCKYFSHV